MTKLGSRQVAVFIDFENLVLGAGRDNPVPYEALSRLCQDYGTASIRKAYADWGQFASYQKDLAMHGVDMIQVPRIGPREFGKWVVGVGTQSNASGLLVSVCSEYKFSASLVAAIDPEARPARDAAFTIATAEQLLLRAFDEVSTDRPTASTLKNKMLLIDPSFDERNYGFRDFLGAFPQHVRRAGRSGYEGRAAGESTTPMAHRSEQSGPVRHPT